VAQSPKTTRCLHRHLAAAWQPSEAYDLCISRPNQPAHAGLTGCYGQAVPEWQPLHDPHHGEQARLKRHTAVTSIGIRSRVVFRTTRILAAKSTKSRMTRSVGKRGFLHGWLRRGPGVRGLPVYSAIPCPPVPTALSVKGSLPPPGKRWFV
jgi:hypothetical protein